MANVLNTDRQIAVIAALAEGSSIRTIERMTGIHRDTIMRLGVKVGQGRTALREELHQVIQRMHGVHSTHVKSVPVKEGFKGKVIWDGIVEVFELHGHPEATHAYYPCLCMES